MPTPTGGTTGHPDGTATRRPMTIGVRAGRQASSRITHQTGGSNSAPRVTRSMRTPDSRAPVLTTKATPPGPATVTTATTVATVVTAAAGTTTEPLRGNTE